MFTTIYVYSSNIYAYVFPGVKFSQVSDLLQLQHMPKVVCAQKSWVGDDEKSSIAVNEVLIIKQVYIVYTV